MDILASPPLRAASIAWQELPGQWTLTVVCKATYALAPGTSALAADPEDVNERENHWDDDPQRSVYAPSDLAPLKPQPEVMLVGSAFAPGGEPVRALFVRMIVGELDKSIEVFGPRTWMLDGTMREGPRWTKMPIRYERAAGGAESWNPVGQSADAVDTHGRRALPNLQPPGLEVSEPGHAVAPIGFGPIASTWRVRREKLRGRAASWSDESWGEAPLGADLDATFFQAAPLDQRVGELRPDEQIVLENLHPQHPRLVTRLSGARPRARVETADMPAWDLTLVADTLWIDTDRAICTLTWRGQAPLDGKDQPGRILLGVEEAGGAVRWPSSQPPPPRARKRSALAVELPGDDDPLIHTAVDDSALVEAMIERDKPVLPFQSAAGSPRLDGEVRSTLPIKLAVPPAPQFGPAQAGPHEGAGAPGRWAAEEPHGETLAMRAPQGRAPMPSWLDVTPTSSSAVPASQPAVAPPPPVSVLLRQSDPGIVTASSAPAAPAMASHGPQLSIGARAAAESERMKLGQVHEKTQASTAYGGVLEASNAAAAPALSPPSSPRAEASATAGASATGAAPARALVELVWFDAAKMARIRQNVPWEPLLAPAPAKADKPPAEDPEAAEQRARAERADVVSVLSRAWPTGDLDAVIAEAAGDAGAVDAPLCVVAGELELPFDDVKMLDVLLGAAGSLAAGDKRVKEVVDLAGEVMKTPLGASPEVAAGFVVRVREAWGKANRMLPADYLDVHARRILLDQRAYQRRVLCNEEWIRALLTPPGESAPIPTYLPAALARWLPLFARFPARLIAEAVPQQDQYESHPLALRALALARVVTTRQRPRSG